MADLHSQQQPPGQAPPPYGVPPGPQPAEVQTPVSSYLMGAMIFLILGAIAMLVADFGGAYWYDYYNGVRGWVWIEAFSAAGLIIFPVAIVMFYMVYWSTQAMRDPSVISHNVLDRWFKVCLAIGSLYLILGLIWAGYSISVEYDDWWLDVGFYGGLIGGYGAALFFYLARNQAKVLGYPSGAVQPPETYPVTVQQPPGL